MNASIITPDLTKQIPPPRQPRKYLKPKVLFVLRSCLFLAAPSLLAQNTNTNTLPLTQTLKYQVAMENDRALGERAVLPPGVKEKVQLTDAQRIESKPIEDDFADQPRIDAAQEAGRQARAAKDKGQIETARAQLQQVWAGLQPVRDSAVTKVEPLLTLDQLKVLEDPKNQWRANHADEAIDPSAN